MSDLEELRSLLTPALLTQLGDAIPCSKTEPVDFAELTVIMKTSFFLTDACKRNTARDALLALSRLCPDGTVPPVSKLDLMSLLPPVSSPQFPQQCYGMQLLLDQASRMLFSGISGRWQSGFFGPLARQFAGQWYALPKAQRPDSFARWRDDVGATCFDYWLVTRVIWAAPFLHAEDLESQKIGLEMSEETRVAVEAYTGQTDPYRAMRDETMTDDTLFLREVVKGLPVKDGKLSMGEYAFWWCRTLDAHWPIIEHFGRYPYRNAILGRETTEAEMKWLDVTGHFSEASPELAARVREDIAKGRWTPLGEE